MLIANQLKNRSRAEYLLYMWQVEDIIRLFGCDIDRLEKEYLSQFKVDEKTAVDLRQWYADLCEMMRSEGKMESGHLQISNNVIIGLEDLNAQLLASEKFPYYRQMYYKVLPYVVELRAKSAQHEGTEISEFTQLFDFLYGVMLLRLQKKEITPETKQAADNVSALLGQLSDYWNKDKAGELKLE